MTGIERLRELAGDEMANGYLSLSRVLSVIADQIDREQVKAAADHAIVASVVADMERHVLGHEGMEDSPVARWSRELRAALGGRGEEVTDVATVRKDAMEAYEWVCERGGLDAVKRRWECLSYYADPVSRACMEKRLARLQRQIDESHAALRRRNEMLKRYEEANEELLERAAAMKRRLMPEGTQWPRFEDGEPVQIGDSVVGLFSADAIKVRSVESRNGYTLLREGCKTDRTILVYPGERVKRPAPKVLDADGAEVRVGDKLYDIKTGFGRTVRAINANKTIEFDGYVDRGWLAKLFTHRAPVLAADGKPLREGETVFNERGDKFTVSKVDHERGAFSAIAAFDGREGIGLSPTYFSHEHTEHKRRPEIDSWERMEEDCAKSDVDYCAERGLLDSSCDVVEGDGSTRHCTDCGCTCGEKMARDLVRRARALAGVSE